MQPRRSTCAKVNEVLKWTARPVVYVATGLLPQFLLTVMNALPEDPLQRVATLAAVGFLTMPVGKKLAKLGADEVKFQSPAREGKRVVAEVVGTGVSSGLATAIQAGMMAGSKVDPTGGLIVAGAAELVGTTVATKVDTLWNRKRTVAGADRTALNTDAAQSDVRATVSPKHP